jgi:hypothetical protein
MPPKNFSIILNPSTVVSFATVMAAMNAVANQWVQDNPNVEPTADEIKILTAIALALASAPRAAKAESITSAITGDKTLLEDLTKNDIKALSKDALDSFASVFIARPGVNLWAPEGNDKVLTPSAEDLATYLTAISDATKGSANKNTTVTFVDTSKKPATASTGTTAEASSSVSGWTIFGVIAGVAVVAGVVAAVKSKKKRSQQGDES